ncbi:hypothetical protein EBU71_14350, partial [bacterium]|nr:hypothetical protein [Candidatus Elulimicrobium humile]
STVVLTPTNNPVVIKPPFIYKVFKLSDIEIISDKTIDVDFTIKWRFSQDYGRSVTTWEPFTKENISTVRISPIRFFQVEYLIELIGSTPVRIYDINLIGDFQNVTLDYTRSNLYGVRANCNSLQLGIVGDVSTFPSTDSGGESSTSPASDAGLSNTTTSTDCQTQTTGGNSGMLTSTPDPCNLPQLTNNDKGNLFQPYQLQSATNLLDKLSNDANTIFGHDVVYFLTDPDKKGIDYTFHEYQLYNYVSDKIIKASVENNQFPENNGAINQFDLSLFDSFEIHIPKVEFKTAFGVDKRPSKEDFIWFCSINKMFNVEHSQAFRGFNNNAIYYKLMLKKFRQAANIIGVNQTITDKVRDLTRNSTIDELFGLENLQDKRAVANKDQFRPLTQDPIRVDITSKIVKELVENAELIISKTHYDLSSVSFSPTYSLPAVVYKNMKDYFPVKDNLSYTCWFNINNYTQNDNYHLFNYYDDTNSLGFDVNITGGICNVKWNSDVYSLNLTSGLSEETWYCYLVNIDQRQRKISQYVYKRNVEEESEASSLNSTKLLLVYSNQQNLTPIEFKLENINAQLLSGDMKLTNLRLFVDVIPEDQHNKILNQTIIRDDSKYLIFADNANQRLVLPNIPLDQISPGEV